MGSSERAKRVVEHLIGDLKAGLGFEVFASLASKHLDLDVVVVAELAEDKLVIRATAGDSRCRRLDGHGVSFAHRDRARTVTSLGTSRRGP